MNATDSQTQKLKKLMLASTKPAYFVINHKMRLIEWSENIVDFGYEGLVFNADASDVFDFIVGYTFGDALDLPIMTTPNGVHASISILPEKQISNVLIMDASYDFQTQFRLQQKANEAELLSQRQRQLMRQLLDTQKELAQKNHLLEESSRLQTRFLSGVSHEFRTPLTSIIGYSDALNETLGKEEKEQISIVQSSAKYLLSLVENLLDHGRLDAEALTLKPKPIPVGEFFDVLKRMLEPVAQQKSISLDCQGYTTVNLLYFDETRVRQCIINIVNNAIKFTDHGGVVINYEWFDEELVVQIIDTGIGMSQTDRDNLFVSFWQSERHSCAGAGLGLTITKRILDKMGGDILVSSELGKGTTIELRFPAPLVGEDLFNVDIEVNNPQKNKEKEAKGSILLVEDDADIAGLVMMYLDDWGFDAHHVTNGKLAVDWCTIGNKEVDLILMDMNMPVLNGSDAIKQMRFQGVSTPIYIMSATDVESIEDPELIKIVEGHLQKPVDFELLNDLLNSRLLEKQNVGML